MKVQSKIKHFLNSNKRKASVNFHKKHRTLRHKLIFKQFSGFTMIQKDEYLRNLELAERTINISGAVVECGVWRGGMIGGIASILGKDREYYLFDSFEGLPEVKDIDGKDAASWQKNTTGVDYFDNCKAEAEYANKAMKIANVSDDTIHIVKGWFNETLPFGNYEFPISLLRLDGDWYESTMTCLQYLFPNVVPGGIIIIDDYHTWEGCAKAIHDYLSRNGRSERICQYKDHTAYLVKGSA